MPETITSQEAAERLKGCEYGQEGSPELWAEMKAAGLVAVFGASDDLMEFRGAIDDELIAYDGAEAFVTPHGLFKPCDDNWPHSVAAQKSAVQIDALWDAGDGEPPWTYETEIPHATFNVFEDGEIFCRGIVFALADAASKSESPNV